MPRMSDVEARKYVAESRIVTLQRPRGRRLGGAGDVYLETADIREANQEHLIVFCVDVRHRIIDRRVVHIGTLTGVEAHPREIFRGAIINKAAAIIIVHNHPSGDISPSRQDLDLTARLVKAGQILGVSVLDHVIVGAGGFTSLAMEHSAIFSESAF